MTLLPSSVFSLLFPFRTLCQGRCSFLFSWPDTGACPLHEALTLYRHAARSFRKHILMPINMVIPVESTMAITMIKVILERMDFIIIPLICLNNAFQSIHFPAFSAATFFASSAGSGLPQIYPWIKSHPTVLSVSS